MALLKSKTALITGGSDGIGFGIGKSFADAGADLVLIGRKKEKLESAREKLKKYGSRIYLLDKDLSDENSVNEISDYLKEKNLKVDILVNNAGIGRFVPFLESDISVLEYHINLNLKLPFLLTQKLLKDLIDVKGNIINISSYFSDKMLQDRPSAAYSLTKGGLNSFTKALAFELGPKGVRVNGIAPGTISTPQVQHNIDCLDNDSRKRFNEMIPIIYPMQKTGEPEDVGNMALFLASEKAKWITGGIFPVDGGLTTG